MSKRKETRRAVVRCFSHRGKGLLVVNDEGRQWVVEVTGEVLRGDEILVTFDRRKRKGYYQGKVEEIVQAAAGRISPRCLHFGECGGCSWQQMPYLMQCQEKQALVCEAFFPFSLSIAPLIAAEQQWHYRNKMEFTFSQDKEGNRFLGCLKRQSSGRVVDLTACQLCSSWFMEVLSAIREWWQQHALAAYHRGSGKGLLETVILREGCNGTEKMIILGLAVRECNETLCSEIVADFIERCSSLFPLPERKKMGFYLQRTCRRRGIPTEYFMQHLRGIEQLHYRIDDQLQLALGPRSFFQPHAAQAKQLLALAKAWIQPNPTMVMYDLYCGIGFFSLFFARFVSRVVGIESNAEAVAYARENAADNGIENATFLLGEVEKELCSLPPPDVIIVDPPRMGLGEKTVRFLAALHCDILYIACNPFSQAKECLYLTAHGYRIEKIQPVDQFPHTFHVENMVYLKRV